MPKKQKNRSIYPSICSKGYFCPNSCNKAGTHHLPKNPMVSRFVLLLLFKLMRLSYNGNSIRRLLKRLFKAFCEEYGSFNDIFLKGSV